MNRVVAGPSDAYGCRADCDDGLRRCTMIDSKLERIDRCLDGIELCERATQRECTRDALHSVIHDGWICLSDDLPSDSILAAVAADDENTQEC